MPMVLPILSYPFVTLVGVIIWVISPYPKGRQLIISINVNYDYLQRVKLSIKVNCGYEKLCILTLLFLLDRLVSDIGSLIILQLAGTWFLNKIVWLIWLKTSLHRSDHSLRIWDRVIWTMCSSEAQCILWWSTRSWESLGYSYKWSCWGE